MTIAIVLGGASTVRAEFVAARALCDQAGVAFEIFAVNDMIGLFEGHVDHAVTLHPPKLTKLPPQWLLQRVRNRWSAPGMVWTYYRDASYAGPQRLTKDWGGSCGLFAVKIARELGLDRILLCGVPMTVAAGHIVRNRPWRDVDHFLPAWKRRKAELAPFLRSFAGWTGDTFGIPTPEFVRQVTHVP